MLEVEVEIAVCISWKVKPSIPFLTLWSSEKFGMCSERPQPAFELTYARFPGPRSKHVFFFLQFYMEFYIARTRPEDIGYQGALHDHINFVRHGEVK